jgi:hypothetical protein
MILVLNFLEHFLDDLLLVSHSKRVILVNSPVVEDGSVPIRVDVLAHSEVSEVI